MSISARHFRSHRKLLAETRRKQSQETIFTSRMTEAVLPDLSAVLGSTLTIHIQISSQSGISTSCLSVFEAKHPRTTDMSFFKRSNANASLIPPVAPPPGSEPPSQPKPSSNDAARNQLFNRSGASNLKSNQSDPYAAAANSRPPSYRTTAGDPYGDGQANDQRGELLGGFQPKSEIPKTRKYGYEGREQEEDFDEDEEIEGIKQNMRETKQESLASTR